MLIKTPFFLVFLFSLLSMNSFANITINPVILELNAQNQTRSSRISIGNEQGDMNRMYEITPYTWTQDADGQEVLTPTTDVVINPKTLYVPRGEQRQVRIGFRQKLNEMDLEKEKSWRIFFKEIQSPLDESGIGISIDFSVPLFAKEKPTKPEPKFKIDHHNTEKLSIHNLNLNHVKIMNIELINAQGKVVEAFPDMKYILADQHYFIQLKSNTASQALQAKIKLDQEPEPILVPISK